MARGWGYKIDYRKEIENDEHTIALLSSDCMIGLAAIVERLCTDPAKPQHWDPECYSPITLCRAAPEAAALLGLSTDDLRDMFHATDRLFLVDEPNPWGEPVDERASYRRGSILLDLFGEWMPKRETGHRGRAELLRLAKAALSRHKRNAKVYG